jgi:hypothetical protein
MASPTYDYQFVDGNGNRFVITKEKLITLQYLPITPLESSSGVYSGGEKKTVFLKQDQYNAFIARISKFQWKTEKDVIVRRKGDRHLFRRKKRELMLVSFAMNDKLGIEIENQLKGYLKIMTPEIRSDSLVGKKFEVNRDESPWLGFSSNYEEEEKGKHIQAKSLPAIGFTPLTSPVELVIEKDSLLYRNESLKEVIVNSRFFSDLERVDVTRLELGAEKKIGTIREPNLNNANLLIPFLLKGQILISFWHTNSEIICLSEEKNQHQVIFHFSGIHYYYTNEKNSSKYFFRVILDQESKEIRVVGE